MSQFAQNFSGLGLDSLTPWEPPQSPVKPDGRHPDQSGHPGKRFSPSLQPGRPTPHVSPDPWKPGAPQTIHGGYRLSSLFSIRGDVTPLWSAEKKALRTQPPNPICMSPSPQRLQKHWSLRDGDAWQLEPFPATGKWSRLLHLCMRWQSSPFIPDPHGPGPGTRGIGQNALFSVIKRPWSSVSELTDR